MSTVISLVLIYCVVFVLSHVSASRVRRVGEETTRALEEFQAKRTED